MPLSDLCDHQSRLFGCVQGVQVFNPGKMLCGSMGRFSSPFSPLKYPDLDHSPLRLDLQTLTLKGLPSFCLFPYYALFSPTDAMPVFLRVITVLFSTTSLFFFFSDAIFIASVCFLSSVRL